MLSLVFLLSYSVLHFLCDNPPPKYDQKCHRTILKVGSRQKSAVWLQWFPVCVTENVLCSIWAPQYVCWKNKMKWFGKNCVVKALLLLYQFLLPILMQLFYTYWFCTTAWPLLLCTTPDYPNNTLFCQNIFLKNYKLPTLWTHPVIPKLNVLQYVSAEF